MSVVSVSASVASYSDKSLSQGTSLDSHSSDFLALLNFSTLNAQGSLAANTQSAGIDGLLAPEAPAPTPDPQTQTQTQTAQTNSDTQSNTTKNADVSLMEVTVRLPQTQQTMQTTTSSNSADNSSPQQNNTADASNAVKSDNTGSSQSTVSTDSATEDSNKKMRQALEDKLGQVDQLLASMMQSMLGNAKPDGQTLTIGAASDTASISLSATITPGQNGAAPVITEKLEVLSEANQPADVAAANDLSLLQDMQSVLQQMQQLLQGGATANASATDTPSQAALLAIQTSTQGDASTPAVDPANTNTILEGLRSVLDKLSQLGSAAPKVATPAAQTANTVTATDTNLPLLKTGLTDIINQLQKAHDGSAAVPSDTSATAVATPSADPKLASQALNATIAQPAAAAPVTAGVDASAAQQQTVLINTTGDTQSLIALAVTPTQSSSDNSGDTSSGGNNQQQAPAQAIAATSQQAQSAKDAGASSFSRALNQAAPTALLEQVSFQVKTGLQNGGSKITIQLHPADMGKMDIKLSVDANGKTTVVVTADNAKTLDMLQRDAQGLARALTDAGLKTDSGSLSFNLGGQQNSNQGSQQQAAAQPVLSYQKTQPDEDEPETNLRILTRSYVVTVSDGVDIQI